MENKIEKTIWIAFALALICMARIGCGIAYAETDLINKSVKVSVENYRDENNRVVLKDIVGVLRYQKENDMELVVEGEPVTKTIVIKKWYGIKPTEDPCWKQYLDYRDTEMSFDFVENLGIRFMYANYRLGAIDFLNRASRERQNRGWEQREDVIAKMAKWGRHWNCTLKQWVTDGEEKSAFGMIYYRGEWIRPEDKDAAEERYKRDKANEDYKKAREAFKKKWFTPCKLSDDEMAGIKDNARIMQNFDSVEGIKANIERCVACIYEATDDKSRETYHDAFTYWTKYLGFRIELERELGKEIVDTKINTEPPWSVQFGIK